MNELLVLFIILLLSYDTTLFLQSMVSQPIFSCSLIGLLCGNFELGIFLGGVCQFAFLSYVPVGGAKIPDVQLGPNLTVVLFSSEPFTLSLVGTLLPVALLLSILFLWITNLERLISTLYMKRVSYENIRFREMIFKSFLWHFILFGSVLCAVFFLAKTYTVQYLEIATFNGERFFYFILLFSLGSLIVHFAKRSFSKV